MTGLANQPRSQLLAINIVIAFLPAAILGLFFSSYIKAYLFKPTSVAIAFIVGGFIILWAEKRDHIVRVTDIDAIKPIDALKIGLAQCAALIPGTSRSGATIIGGLLFGLSRTTATQFSFFLAIPTIFAATLYDGWKHRDVLSATDIPLFAVGFVAAFISALFAVRALLKFIANHSFIVFAWYRIAFGSLILFCIHLGLLG
jgi:undecaprenyl-diphosphatase